MPTRFWILIWDTHPKWRASPSSSHSVGVSERDCALTLQLTDEADYPQPRSDSSEHAVRQGAQRDETTSILDQRDTRRLLPSRGSAPSRRGVDALLDRGDGASRCPPVRSGDLRNDGVGVAEAGHGHMACLGE